MRLFILPLLPPPACHPLYTLLYCCLCEFAACLVTCTRGSWLLSSCLRPRRAADLRKPNSDGSRYGRASHCSASYLLCTPLTASLPRWYSVAYQCSATRIHSGMPSRLASPARTALGPVGKSSRVQARTAGSVVGWNEWQARAPMIREGQPLLSPTASSDLPHATAASSRASRCTLIETIQLSIMKVYYYTCAVLTSNYPPT